ncbi:hypothetical protein GCK72_015218 [Caenorhabditis remanei]|uniref:Transcription factor CBF/NF-Y/archaeal histone domain-containing protein n=1 Tax=Caenorhabditis remanei TaxID=31234 RepID=A0A6A5GTF3_CAERE|nr:hypothetical protein GCK72_015218 [Caenorhabditis remanei]KAF1758758.1 hypothetical protein GCK72_015218 [Caenorhabditis remanei]
MMSSGPLDPTDVTLFSSYPEPIIVPLDFVEKQTKAARDDLGIDESGMYIMSKALEEFMRQIMRESTQNGAFELDYDSLAKYFSNSEFKALEEFFPERVKYGDVIDEMHMNGQSSSS